MDAYYDFSKRPQNWTVEGKKAFLGLYFDDISWNNASAGDINTKFGALMREAKNRMKTDGSLKDTPMQMVPEEEVDESEL